MEKILIGMTPSKDLKYLDLPMINRHGLIAGATGTGKTVTLQTLAEQLSRTGVNVFAADVKGDLSGIAAPGINLPKAEAILQKFGDTEQGKAAPVMFWDIYGEKGQPLRTTTSEMGPLLFGRLLDANTTQQGIIDAAFSVADDEGMLLLDLKDFRSLLTWMGDNAEQLRGKYGNITKTSIGAIQRGLLSLQEAGGDVFFGEQALKLEDLFLKDANGYGYVNILDATKLINDSRLYSTFLLWLLSELFEQLPEVGDIEKPKLVFFFDEAHLLFKSAPKVLLEKIEQLIRLIRSKGVGVFFVTQSPLDIPETVLGQLGNRIQHALRAFTQKDQKAVKATAQTFRQNPNIKTEQVITELGVGEALISFLNANGAPGEVEQVQIKPPLSYIGALPEAQRNTIQRQSPLVNFYAQTIDRESAYEIITRRSQARLATQPVAKQQPEVRTTKTTKTSSGQIIKGTIKVLNSRVAQQIVRGILGSIFGSKK